MPADREGDPMVTDTTGRTGRISARSRTDVDDDLIEITLADRERALVPRNLLKPDGRTGDYQFAGQFEPYLVTADGDDMDDGDEIRIPRVEEEVIIGKQQVETGRVHVSVVVDEREEQVDVPLTAERVEVERVPINRVVETALEPRYEDDTLVIPVVEERLVVQKQLVLTEEVRIRRVSETRQHRERFTLRSQDVEIDRDQPA